MPNLTTALTTPRNNYSVAEQLQEALKTQLTSASAVERTRGQTLHDKITDQVDAAAGSVGKKTALGKQILAVRKQLNKAKSGSSGGTGSGISGSGSGSGSSSDSGSGSGSGSGSASS